MLLKLSLINNLKNNFGPASEFVYADDNDYSDGQVAQQTIRDIKSINQSDNPFFIAVGFQKPHLPFVAPKKYWDLYDRDDIVLPLNNFFPPNAPQKANYFYELRKFTDIPEKGAISDDKAKELIHAYGPEKKVLIMPIFQTIKRIEKTAQLKVKKISSIKY